MRKSTVTLKQNGFAKSASVLPPERGAQYGVIFTLWETPPPYGHLLFQAEELELLLLIIIVLPFLKT